MNSSFSFIALNFTELNACRDFILFKY